MTPQERAKELVEKFKPCSRGDIYDEVFKDYNKACINGNIQHKRFKDLAIHSRLFHAKQCALIAVEEAEKSEYNVLSKFGFVTENYKSDYWQQVKEEIEKL